eukprot:4116625-Amphidinium_carterae.1
MTAAVTDFSSGEFIMYAGSNPPTVGRMSQVSKLVLIRCPLACMLCSSTGTISKHRFCFEKSVNYLEWEC